MGKAILGAAAFVFVFGVWVGVSAQAPQAGPDVSGRWNREPSSGSSSGAGSSRWGDSLQIDQRGVNVTVRPNGGPPERMRLDGVETADVIAAKGCANKTRITKATSGPDRITITTWLVTKSACVHGEDEDDPLMPSTGPIEVRDVRGGPRRLESITVIYREGDSLVVESTTSPVPGGNPTTSSTTYRR